MQLMNESRLNRFARWDSTTVKILGSIEVIFAFLMLIPIAVALYFGESLDPFIWLIPVLGIPGVLQFLLFRESKNFQTVNGLLMVLLAWALVFLIGMVPYYIDGMPFIDALFESVSGLTSTGATIMTDIEAQSNSILVWRGMTQWIGGIAVIIIFMYILPLFGMGRNFFRNELSGSGSSEYSMKMKSAAKSFVLVYLAMTFVNFVLLLLCQVGFIDAFVLSMTTISTGGMMTTSDSLASFSVAVQLITILFMFLGGVNFYLHYRALYKHERGVYRGSSEFKYFAGWLLGISVIIYLMLVLKMPSLSEMTVMDHLTMFKDSLFTVVSLGTTTAFTTVDFGVWPTVCIFLLMLVCFVGGSSGSTSGGVKFGRILMIYEYVKVAVLKTLRPNAVVNVKSDGQYVEESAVTSAVAIFILYIVTMFIGAMVLMFSGLDFVDSFGLSIGTVSNIGAAFGNFGPSGTWAILSPAVKAFLILLMWVGRLEIMIALVFVTPSYWREMWLNHRANKRMSKIH